MLGFHRHSRDGRNPVRSYDQHFGLGWIPAFAGMTGNFALLPAFAGMTGNFALLPAFAGMTGNFALRTRALDIRHHETPA